MKVEWRAYLYIQLLIPVMYMNYTHQQLRCSIAHFAHICNNMAILRFAKYLPSPNGNSVRNAPVK